MVKSTSMTDNEIRRILTDQTKAAVDAAELKIKDGINVALVMTDLKNELRKILKGELIYF